MPLENSLLNAGTVMTDTLLNRRQTVRVAASADRDLLVLRDDPQRGVLPQRLPAAGAHGPTGESRFCGPAASPIRCCSREAFASKIVP
jgi:hypothetical protein